jgi:hypothetical protein
MVKPTPQPLVPPYLSTVTYIDYSGNVPAATLAAIQNLASKRRKRHAALIFGPVLALVAVLAILYRPTPDRSEMKMCYLKLQLQDQSGADLSGLVVDISFGETTNSFVVSPNGNTSGQFGPLTESLNEWKLSIRGVEGQSGLRPKLALQGCPSVKREYPLTKDIHVTIEPR